MKKLILVLSLFLITAQVQAAERLTLKECYQLALKRSETVAIQKELIKETEAQMLVAFSTALPKLAFAYSQKWQDQAGLQHGDQYDPEAKFTLTQPLFTGFKEIAAVGASKHVGKQRQAELKRAQELLFIEVADAFYLYLSYQEDEEAVADIRKALSDRLAELEKRERIGKSRLAEVASAEAKLSKSEATLESVRAQKEVAGEFLSFLVGQRVDRLVVEDVPDQKKSLQELVKDVDTRSDVIAAKESLGSYKNNVTSARSAFLPNVSLGANAYTKRPDAHESNDWDATITVNVPIFNGTNDIGLYNQALAQRNAADLELGQARRRAILEINSAYVRWQSNTRRVAALERSVKAFQRNYDLQLKDFRNNLVNSLDILTAIEDLQTVRRDLIVARVDCYRSFWFLKVVSGDTYDPVFGGMAVLPLDKKR